MLSIHKCPLTSNHNAAVEIGRFTRLKLPRFLLPRLIVIVGRRACVGITADSAALEAVDGHRLVSDEDLDNLQREKK